MLRLGRQRFRLDLRAGIPLVLSGCIVLISLIGVCVHIATETRYVAQEKQTELRKQLSALQASLEFLFSIGAREQVQQEIAEVRGDPSMEFAVVTDEHDRILAAERREVIGRDLMELISAPHLPDQFPGFDKILTDVRRLMAGTVIMSPDRRFITGVFPVILGASPDRIRPNRIGLLYVQKELRTVSAQARSRAIREELRFIAALAVILIILLVITQRLVTRRIQRVVDMIIRFAAGDTQARVGISGHDEIAEIGVAFDAMAEEVAATHRSLHDSEERYRTLIEVSPQIIWQGNADGYITYCNQWWFDYTGLSMEQTEGQGWTQAIHPDHRERVKQAWLGIARTGDIWDREILFRRARDGAYRWHLARGLPARDEKGKIVKWMGTAMDIHDRKQAEQAQRDSELRLNAIIASAMDAIVAVDEDLHIVLFNQAAEQIYGYRAADILGQPLDRLMPERFRAAHRQHMTQFARSKSASRRLGTDGNIIGLRANGEEFPVETAISQIAIGDKTLYMAILRDITERLRAEEVLRESQAQLSGIITSAMDAIIMVDDDQHIVLFNSAAEQMFGYRQSQILGQSLNVLIPERFRTVHRKHIADFGHSQTTRRKMGALGTVFGLTAEGREFPIEASISQLSLGNRKHYTVILRDVAKRLETEEQIRSDASRIKALAQRVQDAQEAERRLLALELHDEIGQVLTAVKLNIEGVSHHYQDAGMTARLKESTALVDRAIQQVRDRALDLRPSMLDDLGLVPALSWYLERQAERGGLQMEFKAPAKRPQLSPAIETAVYRVVQEAVTNCLRHARAQRLQVELRQRDSCLEVLVQDDGVGFDLSAIEGTTNQSLGLTSMRERIELFDGTLTLASAPGQGTVVRAEIPLAN